MTTAARKMDPDGKREAVCRAGEALFASRGYAGTTMAEIAREAGVAVGTLYTLFPDKRALLTELHRRMERRFADATQQGWAAGQTAGERLDRMVDALFIAAAEVADIMPLYELTRDTVSSDDYRPGAAVMAVIHLQYTEAVSRGDFHAHDPAAAAAIAHGMVEGAMRDWAVRPGAREQRRTIRELKVLLRRAFLKG